MGIFRQLYKFRSTLILIITPIALLQLFIFTPPAIYKEIACAYTILLMAVYWVTEVVPLAVTALLPLVLYPLLGVVPAKDVSVKYLKDVNVLFLGGLTVAVAVEHWSLHKRVALKVLTKVGAKPRWLLFGFMITTAFLSMWISNVATTAMMIPIAQAVLDELSTGQDKENSGGDSGVGTPHVERNAVDTNHQAGDYLATSFNNTQSHISAEMGNITAAQELGYRLAGANRFEDHESGYRDGYAPVPRENNEDLDFSSSECHGENGGKTPTITITESNAMTSLPPVEQNHVNLTIPENYETSESPVNSRTELISRPDQMHQDIDACIEREKMRKGLAKALTISVCYAANIGGTATLTGTGPNLIMAGLFKTAYPKAPEVDFGSWAFFAFFGMLIFLLLCWLWLQYLFLNLNWREIVPCCFARSKKTVEERQTEAVIKRQYDQLGSMSFAEKSVLTLFIILAMLWLTRDPGFVKGWGSIPIFREKYVSDATVAMLIAFLLFVCPSKRPNFFCCRSKTDASEMGPVSPLLTWQIVQQKMAWNVILLLGGGFAMAYGSEESGLSKLIGSYMVPLKVLPSFAANVICCLFICLMTQCTSNTATATVFLPILAELAKTLGVNPLLLMLPSTLITSYAFMLPVSTPPNAIAYSYGHLSMKDMLKAGSVMNVLGVFIALFSAYVFGQFAFHVNNSCPDWLNSTLCDATIHQSNNATILNDTSSYF